MYLNTVVLWTVISFSAIAEVCSKRFASPRHLFSDEPNIFDEGTYYASQNEHKRFARSIDGAKESSHKRTRRFSQPINPVKRPEISDSKALCDHDRLVVRWTDTNLVSTSVGAIIALCRESSANKHDSAVFISYDYGKSFQNITGKFEELADETPTIDMYYTVAKKPNFILFADRINKYIFYSYDGGRTMQRTNVTFFPDEISINPRHPNIVVATDYTGFGAPGGKTKLTRLFISKDMGKTYNILRGYVDVYAFYWGDEKHGDQSTDLFIEAKKTGGQAQGYQLDCSTGTGKSKKTCSEKRTLTTGAPLNGDITDFLVKGPYMFVTQQNKVKGGLNLFVKYPRSGTFKQANIITRSAIKEIFVYDVDGGHVMLIVNHRVNETNLYNSLDHTGSNYSLSLPRVLYHNPKSEVSSHWLRSAVKYRFVDIRRVEGLPSVYFATQLTVGPVGGRYLISKMTFDKGGLWKKIKGPEKNKWGRPCHYPVCSLHVNLLYGSIYRYSKTTPLMSRKSAPGLLMATGVLGTNLKITPDTYLSRDGGNTFKQVLSGKRRFGFGDHGGFVLASDFEKSGFLQYSVDFENFYHVPFGTSRVDIKKILTEPGERGVVFLVIGTINGFYHIFQVNATRSLGRQCAEKDFYTVNVTDIGVGGCAVKQIELRNSSTRCLTGKNYTRVVSISYNDCRCRRRHYQCDLKFAPDKRGSCVQIPGTSLIPSHCPEGQFFMQSRGYSKLPEYATCTEDNETLSTLSYVKVPCPVETLQLALVKTKPEMTNRMTRVPLGENLHAKVVLRNGFLPHVNFLYRIGDFNRSGNGPHHTMFNYRSNKTGSFVLHITVSNRKSNLYYSVNVNVIRKLNASTMQMNLKSYPQLPGVNEKVTFMLQMSKDVNPREYGFPLTYKWRIDSFVPTQTTIFQTDTRLPTMEYTFKNSGDFIAVLTASNGISSVEKITHVQVTKDLKPKNVKLSYREPRILKVEWDQVNEPGIMRYRVQYRKLGQSVWEEPADCRPKSTETQCEIANVTYNTVYSVKVDAALGDGYGAQSNEVSIKIPSGTPEVPQKVKLANKELESLEASWQPPRKVNGKLIAYWYKFYKAGESPPSPKKLDVKITNKVFDKLEQDVNYMFEVAAANEEKTGLYSETISARTGVDKPTLPPTGIVARTTATTATLTWTAPKLKPGSQLSFSPKSYNIYMKKDGKMTKVDSASENTYTFTKLNPNTKYDVAISAVADKGEGPQGAFSFTTKMGPPEAPVNLKATAITFSEATLTWSPASADNAISYYTVYQRYPDSKRMGKFDKTTGKVQGLMPYTQYKFAVSATNEIAESEESDNCTFTTAEHIPDKPGDMRKFDLWPESSSINITWTPPKIPNGIIIKYTVSWHPEADNKMMESADVSTGLWLRVDHLRGETNYLFQVQAWTKIGIGVAHSDVFKTIHYPYGSQAITIPFEEINDIEQLFQKKNFKKSFISAVAERSDIKPIRIADVRLNAEKNAVVFELITKEDLQSSKYSELLAEMDKVKAKLQPSFTVNGAKTKANALSSGDIHPGEPSASGRSSDGGSTNMALIVGLVCAAVIIALLVVLMMMFLRYRRKSFYNKFDNQFQYNHDDDGVRYQQSPEIEMAPPPQKHRHKDIETVPLAEADELT